MYSTNRPGWRKASQFLSTVVLCASDMALRQQAQNTATPSMRGRHFNMSDNEMHSMALVAADLSTSTSFDVLWRIGMVPGK